MTFKNGYLLSISDCYVCVYIIQSCSLWQDVPLHLRYAAQFDTQHCLSLSLKSMEDYISIMLISWSLGTIFLKPVRHIMIKPVVF